MKTLLSIIRVLYGLILLTFGLNGFFKFIPIPPLSDEGNSFLLALNNTGYMLPLWKSIEALCGLLLLINRFTLLALVFIAPVLLNIFMFHLFLDIENLTVPTILLVFQIVLLIERKKSLKSLLDV
jgi:uncharacterized membrane protein YphA (DoxX/SURF4 family)